MESRDKQVHSYTNEGSIKFEMVDSTDWPEKRKSWTFETFKPHGQYKERQEKVKSFIQNNLKEWYVLHGVTHTGKSHLSTALVKERRKLQPGLSFIIEKFRTINASIREDFSKELQVLAKYSTPDILVIEELGKSYGTNFELNNLFEIIDRRDEACLQTILTTNMPKEDFLKFIGDYAEGAIKSRLADRCRFVHFDWPTYQEDDHA